MIKSLEQRAAAIKAIADKIVHGENAKPSGFWGLAIGEALELDALLKDVSQADLEAVLDRVCNDNCNRTDTFNTLLPNSQP